jgi:molybdopterin converting factor small subunit
MAAVRIPPTLRAEVGGVRELEARGDTVGAVIDDLVERYPPLAPQLLANGELASYVNVYLGGEDIRTLDGLETPVYDGETIILLPAMAGGAVGVRPVESDPGNVTRGVGPRGV